MTTLLVILLLWTAGLFTLVAAIGLLRFPDTFTRMHGSTKVGTVGVIAAMIALSLFYDDPGLRTRAFLTAAFLFITAPIASHVIGRAAMLSEHLCLVPRSNAPARGGADASNDSAETGQSE